MEYVDLNFGEVIQTKRTQLRLSQKEVAAKVGVVRCQITNIEKGIGRPSIDVFLRLISVLELYEWFSKYLETYTLGTRRARIQSLEAELQRLKNE